MRLSTLLFEIDFSVGPYLLYQNSEMFTGVSMHAFVQSFVRYILSIHPSIAYVWIVYTTLFHTSVHTTATTTRSLSLYMRYVDGDKRCETLLDCQIGGGRWHSHPWVNEPAKQANSRSAWRERERETAKMIVRVWTSKSQSTCVFCMLDAFSVLYMLWSYLYFSTWRKKTKLFHIFVFFTDFAGSFVHFGKYHTHINCSHEWRLLTVWVGGFFLLLRTQMK